MVAAPQSTQTGNDEPSSRSSRERTVNTGSAADLLRRRQARRSFDLRPSRHRSHHIVEERPSRRQANLDAAPAAPHNSSALRKRMLLNRDHLPMCVTACVAGDPCPAWPPRRLPALRRYRAGCQCGALRRRHSSASSSACATRMRISAIASARSRRVNNQARCAVSVARWSPTHRSSSTTYGIA